MEQSPIPRALTHDEQKAAEAAFVGRPFNPAWSASAKKVYEGLIKALPKAPDGSSVVDPIVRPPSVPSFAEPAQPMRTVDSPESVETLQEKPEGAMRSEFLIDVTDDAKKVGLSISVSMTKPLWEIGVAATEPLSEDERMARLRDILMAFRLRLATQATLSPLIDFPALLALPPGSTPQAVPLFALIQSDAQNRAMATLLLPNEVSTTIVPMN